MTYDDVGNLLTRSRVSGGTVSTTLSYNRNSDQVSKDVQGSSSLSYTYDADGNMLTRALGKTTQLSIAYNADGRPKTAAGETFSYDAFEERVALTVSGGGAHDIYGLNHELLAENNTTGQAQRSYIYLNGIPLAVVDSFGQFSYVLSNQLGQPQKMTNSGGALVWDMVSDEFGQVVAQAVGQTSANSLRFPGQVADAATGLYYNYHRDYDPALGRYDQTDPVGLKGGIDPYAYVGDNPIVRADLTGLWQVTIGAGDGIAGLITFGLNSGQWNFGVGVGAGEGFMGSIDFADSGCKDPGLEWAGRGDADFAVGRASLDLGAELSPNGVTLDAAASAPSGATVGVQGSATSPDNVHVNFQGSRTYSYGAGGLVFGGVVGTQYF